MPLRNVRGLLRTQAATSSPPRPETFDWRQNRGTWKLAERGFSDSSSSDRLIEEQENQIAENIFDWWISGKSYKRWYADKFLQLKIKFDDK